MVRPASGMWTCTWRRKKWSFLSPLLTTTAPGVPKSASTKKVTWYVMVVVFTAPCFALVFLPLLSGASGLSFPFPVSALVCDGSHASMDPHVQLMD